MYKISIIFFDYIRLLYYVLCCFLRALNCSRYILLKSNSKKDMTKNSTPTFVFIKWLKHRAWQ